MSQRKSKSKNGITKGSVPFANRLPSCENTVIIQISRRPAGKVVVLRGVRKANSSVICYYELFCAFITPTNGWMGCGYQFYAPTADSLKRAKHALQIRAASAQPEVQLKDSGNLQRPKINAYVSHDTSDLREMLAQATKVEEPIPKPGRIVAETVTLLSPRPQFNSQDYPAAIHKKSWMTRSLAILRNFFLG